MGCGDEYFLCVNVDGGWDPSLCFSLPRMRMSSVTFHTMNLFITAVFLQPCFN